MQKILNGSDLAGYIKSREAQEIRSLLQSRRVQPKLAIIYCKDDPAITTYIRLKKRYGADIGILVDIHYVSQPKIKPLIDELNQDKSVHGIIIQLPLEDTNETETIVNLVAPTKDVDALGAKSIFQPATPTAILWLLAGYNISLENKQVVLIGRGKLVGAPLEKMLQASRVSVTVADSKTDDLKSLCLAADIIVTATGKPGVLRSDMIKTGTVVVDAGVASEENRTIGDVADDIYERDDITITPRKGGVGPLTVCSLFENVIIAARNTP